MPKEEGAKGGESYDARMDDEWLGNGLRILRLVDDVFVLDPHHRCGRIGGPWFIDQGKLKGSSVEETPLDILKKRYASGEIDKEEFETMRRELM